MFNFFKDYLENNEEIGFKSRPQLNYEYDDLFSLVDDLIYFTGKEYFVVPKKLFLTDLASIPKNLEHVFPNNPKYNYPSILHDYLYSKDREVTLFKRVYADWYFLQALRSEKVSFIKRWLMFLAVRLRGHKYYVGK